MRCRSNTEPVLEPAALNFLTACGQVFPEGVDFFLRLAVHDQGYRLGHGVISCFTFPIGASRAPDFRLYQ